MKICAECERYVQMSETECPFCQSKSLFAERKATRPSRSRAQAFAARAALASATLSALGACGGEIENEMLPPTGGQASGGVAATGGLAAIGGQAATGGVPASGGQVASGGQLATGGEFVLGTGGVIDPSGGMGGEPPDILIYGGPFPDMMKARV